jgi:hypothetical protein
MLLIQNGEQWNSDGNLFTFTGNDTLNSIDVLGLMLFQNESCQDCNASFWWHKSIGTVHYPERVPCKWKSGDTGAFFHACSSLPLNPGICDTITHTYMRAFKDTCCERFVVKCMWVYVWRAEGMESAKINVQISFWAGKLRVFRIMQWVTVKV